MTVMAKNKKISKSTTQKKTPLSIKLKQNEDQLKLHKDKNKKPFLKKLKNVEPEFHKKIVEKKFKTDKISDYKSVKILTKEAKKKTFSESVLKTDKKESQKVHSKLVNKSKKEKITNSSKKKKSQIARKEKAGDDHKNYLDIPVDSSDSKMESSVSGKSSCDDGTLSALPQVGFIWGNDMEDLNQFLQVTKEDSEEEEDEKVEVTKAKPKLTKAERAAIAKAEEAKTRAAEDELLENGDPVSPDGFDRMLLAQPDCSELWLKYMAYHLQATEIEKARAVARRALTIINIRCEGDRLNVWTALMNLEQLYGTKDSLQACVHEALRCNDEVKVYSKLMNIYATSGQIRDLDSTIKLLLKKAGTGHNSVNVYLLCANTLLQHGQKDTARHVLQRGLNNLPPTVHVTLISRFALAENKHGDSDHAQALFEHTLTSYPSRVDVWGVYVDMLVKSDRVDLARQVIQRGVTQKLPPKKLKPLYTKWLKLEEQYGDIEAVESVKKEIEKYVKDTRGKLGRGKLML